MSRSGFEVDIHLCEGSGAVKAFAMVRILIPEGPLELHGFKVIQTGDKPVWVAFPSKEGKTPGKYWPTTEAGGETRKRLIEVVLEAYKKAKGD